MGSREDFKQEKDERSRKILSVVERVHGRRRYIGKKREFEKCRRNVGRIQRKDKCGG